jgi:transposase
MALNKKSKQLNFTGQDFFIGIDTHKKNWKVAIRSNRILLRNFSMNPQPIQLYEFMNKNYPHGTYYSVYESGFCGYWIHRELTNYGIKNIVVNAADVPTSHKEKDRKSDPVDCNKLSRELESGSLTGIFIPIEEQQALRSLSRYLKQLTKRSTQIKNRIKSLLYFNGVIIPPNSELYHWSFNFIKWLQEVNFTNAYNRQVLDNHIEDLKYIRLKKLKVLREIRKEFKVNAILKLLKRIPGIGTTTAFNLYTELMDIRRFKTFDFLASFVGLVPSMHNSGEKEISSNITVRCLRYLRGLLGLSQQRYVKYHRIF